MSLLNRPVLSPLYLHARALAPTSDAAHKMQAARFALLLAAAGLSDGLYVRPALRCQHARVAARRSVPAGASMALLPSLLTDAQGEVDAQRVASAARLHDRLNLVATGLMSGMVVAARCKGGAAWDLRLAITMGSSLVLEP